MSLDPFEARLQFLKLVRTLNASQQSIQKVVSFAVKYGARCGDDLWECIGDEIGKVSSSSLTVLISILLGTAFPFPHRRSTLPVPSPNTVFYPCSRPQGSLNARINILYLLDSLAETSSTIGPPDAPYLPLIERHLPDLVSAVVPNTREGRLNARSARLILESWRARRVLDPSAVDAALSILAERTSSASAAGPASGNENGNGGGGEKGGSSTRMSRSDILRRIEEDRERQKRLRERMWILPIPPLRGAPTGTGANPSPASPSPFALTPASPKPGTAAAGEGRAGSAARRMLPPRGPVVQPLDVEFEQMWEGASDLDDDDFERMRE